MLLTSDLKNFFLYPTKRHKGLEDTYTDIYDGITWKKFETLLNEENNEKLIGLQWCWDGADAFNDSGTNFWPGCYSILNFPIDLRSKLHIGLHVVTLCTGEEASIRLMVEELKSLWTIGILVNGITWKVALINGVWDGRGYEKVTCTQGAGSLFGCNVCTFPGILNFILFLLMFISLSIHCLFNLNHCLFNFNSLLIQYNSLCIHCFNYLLIYIH